MTKNKKQLLVFGRGYTTKYLEKQITKTNNWQLLAVSRSKNDQDVNFYDTESTKKAIYQADAILSTAPNTGAMDPILEKYGEAIKKSKACWIGYLSSTGVYGDHQGKWVNELSLCKPEHITDSNRLAAEQQWLKLFTQHKKPVHIFRLAGIYGPKRNNMLRIQQGKDFTVIKENQFFSRIHVEDACQILIKSLENINSGEIYNVADTEPASANTVDQYAAELLNIPKLKEISFSEYQQIASPQAIKFYQASKKVSSQKVLEELKVQLRYPDFKKGLKLGCME